jgi:hypothetical protein
VRSCQFAVRVQLVQSFIQRSRRCETQLPWIIQVGLAQPQLPTKLVQHWPVIVHARSVLQQVSELSQLSVGVQCMVIVCQKEHGRLLPHMRQRQTLILLPCSELVWVAHALGQLASHEGPLFQTALHSPDCQLAVTWHLVVVLVDTDPAFRGSTIQPIRLQHGRT